MAEPKTKEKRYIGKIRNIKTQYGEMQVVAMDNPQPTNKDGSDNTYHAGTLVWFDKATGKAFQVLQASVSVPKDGMHPNLAKNGYVAQLVLDLNNTYDVAPLE